MGLLLKNRPTKLVVISRSQNKIIAKYEHEVFFCFHVISAFEQDNSIVIDQSQYPDLKCFEKKTVEAIVSGQSVADVRPMRFILPNLSQAVGDGP